MTDTPDSDAVTRPDNFRGDNAHLIRCIDALLDLDDAKALVPHGLGKGSHAYELLTAARHRLSRTGQASTDAGAGRGNVSEGVYLSAVKGREDFRTAFREQRDIVHRYALWSDDEKSVISDLGKKLDLSDQAVLRQALRLYQRDVLRREAGETVTWSGDEQRMRDFAGPIATLPPASDAGGASDAIPAPVSGADAVIAYIDDRITSFFAGEHSSKGPDANNLVVRELTYVLHLLAGNIYPEHPAREMKRVAQNELRVGLDTDCQSHSSLPHRLTGLEVRESGIEPLSSDLSSLACPSTPPQPFHNNSSDFGAQSASFEPCLHTWCGFDGRRCFDCDIRFKIEAYRNSGVDECLAQIPALERMLNRETERNESDGK